MVKAADCLRATSSAVALISSLMLPATAWAGAASVADQAQATADGSAAGSQPAPSGADASADSGKKDQTEIVVTGTNISGVKPVGSQAVVITRKDAEKTGLINPADVVRTLPQVRNIGDDHEGNTSYILTNGGQNTGINIRGLGDDATLILIDGRRIVATGTNITTTNPNQLPIAALDRIEVITDGTSAIYGSDAVAGVVNFVVRKDYDGAELSTRVSDASGPTEWEQDLTAGKTWNEGTGSQGNLLITFQHSFRDNYLAGDNPRLRFDGSPFGGVDERLLGNTAYPGLAPNIVVQATPTNGLPLANPTIPLAANYTYFGLPTGANVGLPASALLLNQPNLVDPADYTDFLGREKRYSTAVFFNQKLGDGVELFAEGNYLNRKVISRSLWGLAGTATVNLQSTLIDPATGLSTGVTNPYYIFNVPGVSQGIPFFGIPADPLSVQYATLKDGVRSFKATDKSYNLTGGIRADLPYGWKAEAYYTYGRNSGCTYCTEDNLNPTALQYQVDIGAINPLSSVPLTGAQRATVYGTQTQIGRNGLDDAVLKFNGPLFELPGGTARAAVGVEREKSFASNASSANAGMDNATQVFTTFSDSRYSRTSKSAFGEIYLPLIGEDQHVPLIRSLILSGAVRYDHYSDAGQSTNPKIGFDWKVTPFLKFAGSYGTSYHAPSLAYKNPSAYSSGVIAPMPNNDPRVTEDIDLRPFGIPLVLANTALIFGANPDLKPEKAKTLSLSAELDFKPFRFSANYYKIDYRDRISFPGIWPFFITGVDVPNYEGYGSFAHIINNPATCSNSNPSSADPALQPYLTENFLYSPAAALGQGGGLQNFCSVHVLLDSRFFNLARAKQEGLDLNGSFSRFFGEVSVNVAASANVVLSNREQPIDGEPFVEQLGTYGTPVKWRGRGNVGLFYRGASVTLFGNYYGSYINDQAVNSLDVVQPPVRVPSYTTFDLNLGYEASFKNRAAGFLKGIRGAFTIINLFDKLPPVVLSPQASANGTYNPAAGMPFGRRYTVQLTGVF